jgi:outer membrane lipoprotein-sorting protein
VDYNAFLGSFLNHIKQSDDIKISIETKEEKELIIAEFEVPEPNKYIQYEKLWIDPGTCVPVKAEIYGSDGKKNVEVYYNNFVCNPDLKDGDFEIIQKN